MILLDGLNPLQSFRYGSAMMRTLRPAILGALLMLLGLLVAACQSEPQAQATPAVPPAATTVGAANTTATESAPGGLRQIPTASPGKSVVHGIILSVDTKKPLTEVDGVDVFLAGTIYSTDKTQRLASLDKATAPRADPDKNGVFVFADVPPGEYAIAARGPMGEVLAHKQDEPSKDLIFTVTAGQTLDLGQLYAKNP